MCAKKFKVHFPFPKAYPLKKKKKRHSSWLVNSIYWKDSATGLSCHTVLLSEVRNSLVDWHDWLEMGKKTQNQKQIKKKRNPLKWMY